LAGGRKLSWLDAIAIMIVVAMFLLIPFTAFALAVAGYGVISSLAHYALWGSEEDVTNAAIWAVIAVLLTAFLTYLVKWHRAGAQF